MVNNRAEDVKSLSDMKEDEIQSDLFGLWVKLKIPKEEQGMNTIADQKIGFTHKDDHETNKITSSNNTKRVCHFCQKVFNSGKALGGHMRIHVQQSNEKNHLSFKTKLMKVRHTNIKFKKQNPRDKKVTDFAKKISSSDHSTIIKKPTNCLICGKDFPSMKSLFGHMRCHPDRVWRGIHPPSNYMAKNNSSSSSSSSSFSSSLSDAGVEQSKIVDQIEILGFREKNEVVDLMESLSGWLVTARRGRKAVAGAGAFSSENDELLEAVNCLMMLSRGGIFGESMKKLDGNDDYNCFSDDNDEMNSKNTTKVMMMMMKNKKKRKKVKLCDLEMAKDASSPLHHHKVVEVIRDDKYSCERSVSPKDDNDSFNPIIAKFVEETKVRSVLEFDLNEVPSDDQ